MTQPHSVWQRKCSDYKVRFCCRTRKNEVKQSRVVELQVSQRWKRVDSWTANTHRKENKTHKENCQNKTGFSSVWQINQWVVLCIKRKKKPTQRNTPLTHWNTQKKDPFDVTQLANWRKSVSLYKQWQCGQSNETGNVTSQKKTNKKTKLLLDWGTFFSSSLNLHFEEYRRDGRVSSGPVVWGVEVQLGAQLPVGPRAAEGVPGRRLEPWRRRARRRMSHGEAGRGEFGRKKKNKPWYYLSGWLAFWQ